VAQLRHHETELHALNVQVLTISFSTEYWARGWLQETASPFPLLRDPERSTYAAYQLSSSRLGAWSPRTLWHYFRLRLGGTRRLPAQGDPHQMGGDFIVDAGGVLRLSHKSKDPVDRPDVALLLETLRNLPYRR
jgi:alkyl hydroperoxide reductase subunit AhpC